MGERFTSCRREQQLNTSETGALASAGAPDSMTDYQREKNMNKIVEAAVRAAEGNDGEPIPPAVWLVPETAQITLSDAPATHLLTDAVLAWWME